MSRVLAFRVGRLLAALALAFGFFLFLSRWMGHAAPDGPPRPAAGDGTYIGRAATALLPDPRVAPLMGQISTGTLYAYERVLTGEEAAMISGEPYTISTRYSYSGEPISQATRYAYEHFEDLGLDVTFHNYGYAGNVWRNVVAERTGLWRADEIFLITAHLDDMPGNASVAPGADDNASGSTGVLVAADVLMQLDFDCTLRFVLFTGEEQGLQGSAVYAADVAAAGDDVRGVLNLDMIGFNSDADPIVDLHARSSIPGSVAIAETFSQVVAAYDLNLTPDILVDHYLGNYSDNKSFWDHGYAAILTIEDSNDFSPYYHTVSDTLDTLDLDYFTEIARAAVGTIAHMGCLVDTGFLTGAVTALDTGLPLSATVTATTTENTFTTTASADGTYSLTLPVGTYSSVVAMPKRIDYWPAVITDVIILTDTATIQHFVLEPRPEPVTGLLTGTVTALDTGLPLSATVTASTAEHTFTSTASADGGYSLTLPVDAFTVTAMSEPSVYMSAVVSNVFILTDTMTVQNFILEVWFDRFFLPVVFKMAQ